MAEIASHPSQISSALSKTTTSPIVTHPIPS
jgi:hypothetical protein